MSTIYERIQALSAEQQTRLAQRLGIDETGTGTSASQSHTEPRHQRLVAYAVAHPGIDTTPDELRLYLQDQLPDYMVPAEFVLLDELPRTPNGKVDREALPRLAPEHAFPSTMGDGFVAPRTAAEEQLAHIWAQVLGFDMLSVHDNFFEVGGDSILSIQIVAKANQAGLKLTPQQLFQHPTIAELAAVAETTTAATTASDQRAVTGNVALTPIQHWFFEQNLDHPQQWNQALLLQTPADVEVATLQATARHLLHHHDALRLRFHHENGRWQQRNAAPDDDVPFTVIDLSQLAVSEWPAAIEKEATVLHRDLRLNDLLVRFAYFDGGGNESGHLLILAHHLLVDGVSWRILLEDWQTVYQQLAQAQPVTLSAKTASYQEWARRLTDYAHSETLQQELSYWQRPVAPDVAEIPADKVSGDNHVASARRIVTSLSAEETEALLNQVPQAYHTQVNDVLLTALLQAFANWIDRPAFLFGLEGHGRESLFADVDLSRTVGWFTSFFPVTLHLDSADSGTALKSVKEQLRAVPQRGIGYGLLRYLSGDTAVTAALQARPQPQVTFNYLGQFQSPAGPFTPIYGPEGETRHLCDQRCFLLEIDGHVSQGRLQFNWTYSENRHHRETIATLAESHLTALRTLMEHCLSLESSDYTPSDFDLADLDQDELDVLSGLLDESDD